MADRKVKYREVGTEWAVPTNLSIQDVNGLQEVLDTIPEEYVPEPVTIADIDGLQEILNTIPEAATIDNIEGLRTILNTIPTNLGIEDIEGLSEALANAGSGSGESGNTYHFYVDGVEHEQGEVVLAAKDDYKLSGTLVGHIIIDGSDVYLNDGNTELTLDNLLIISDTEKAIEYTGEHECLEIKLEENTVNKIYCLCNETPTEKSSNAVIYSTNNLKINGLIKAKPDNATALITEDGIICLQIHEENKNEDLAKRLEVVEFEIKRAQGMLANANFVAKAPADKVQAERDKLQKYQAEREQILLSLKK